MKTPARHFRFALELNQEPEGWQGTLISLDEGQTEFELTEITNTADTLAWTLAKTKAKYEGTSDGSAAKGHWLQRTAKLDLTFERVDEVPKEKLKALWTGTINVVVQKLDVQIRELETGDIYFDSVTQKVGGFVGKRTVDGETVKIEVPGLNASFEGALSEDGSELVGKWKQGFLSPSLTLTKQDNPVEELAEAAKPPARPQTPQAPFPYSIEEVQVSNSEAKVTLAGTLTIPKAAKGKVPAVVLVSGSGPQDRDESIAGHKPFSVIADYFSRNGIAVLRYDDRGTAESTGDFSTATSVDFANDAGAAVAYLRSRPEINAGQIGIAGHSEGGLIAPMVAVQDEGVAFIILMAGPGVNGEKILVSQGALILQASGMSKEEIMREALVQQSLIDLTKETPRLTDAKFKEKALAIVERLLEEAGDSEQSAEEVVQVAAAQLRSPWFEYFLTYEPKSNLEQVKCAVLAINGAKDLQVEPKMNLEAIEQALKVAPTSDFRAVELPELNHLFQTANTGLMDEYGEIEETFNEGALKLMTDWILEHTN
ncbi:MAG: alpha/beta fold hydrolase [Planctomycetota bacterium]